MKAQKVSAAKVERNHEPVCRIEPIKGRKPVTTGDFEEWWKSLPRPDDKFADDLEEIHNMFRKPPQAGRTKRMRTSSRS